MEKLIIDTLQGNIIVGIIIILVFIIFFLLKEGKEFIKQQNKSNTGLQQDIKNSIDKMVLVANQLLTHQENTILHEREEKEKCFNLISEKIDKTYSKVEDSRKDIAEMKKDINKILSLF